MRATNSSGMRKRVWISLVGFGVATRVLVGCGEPPLDDLTRPLPGSDAGGTVAVPSGIRAKGGAAGTKSTGGRAPVASVPGGGMPAAPAGEAGEGGEAIAEPPPSSTGGSGGRAGAATGGRVASGGGKASTGGAAANTGGAAPNGGATEISGGSDGSGGASSSGGATPLPETGGTSTGGQGTGGGAQGTGGGAPEPPSRAIWFTEYVEGASGTRKALEISTLEETTLLGCRVDIYSNGSPEISSSTDLDSRISPESPWVLCTKELVQELGAVCSEQVGLNFNGDDAITLVCESQIVDSIGTVGEVRNPKYWGTPELKTADTILRRVCSVTQGDPIAGDAFDPAVEWEAVAPDALDGLGSHCREP